jgi:hypothetical protein
MEFMGPLCVVYLCKNHFWTKFEWISLYSQSIIMLLSTHSVNVKQGVNFKSL